MVAYAAWWQGDVIDVRDHSRQGLALYDPELHRAGIVAYNQNPGIICGYLDALSDWALGYPEQARRAMAKVVAHARELEHPYSIGITLLFAAQLAQLDRDPDAACAHAEESLRVSAEHDGLPAVALWCLLPRGWATTQQGDAAAGIADIREAMDRRRAFGIGAVWPWFLALFAEALARLGQFTEGLDALSEAEQWSRRNDEHLYEAEVHRIRGELLLGQDIPDPAQAEACFGQALAVARSQQAKSWELRAAISLARLWQSQHRRDDAHELLAPVYDWFTEGFDSPDLRDAQTLLHQMS